MKSQKSNEVRQSEKSAPGSGRPASDDGRAEAGAERGRPGRRSAAQRREAVLSLLSGKGSVDNVAKQYGVLPDTVVGWRDAALQAIENAMNMGSGSTARERDLMRENTQLRETVTSLSIERALAVQAVREWQNNNRPTRPARSRR